MKIIICIIFLINLTLPLQAVHQPEYSTAGFFQLDNSGRHVYNMNVAWRFFKGECKDAFKKEFNDRDWPVVSLPHGIEYLPTEASGSINFQGEVWYRKHFTLHDSIKGEKIFLHFEGIMGKCKIWINGKFKTEHFGGYLPVITDISDDINWNTNNTIAVWADNSNDPSFPPGKKQELLDYTYFGGIYRDCWLITHHPVYITDPNYENITGGGGLFVAYDKVNESEATILLQTHIRNSNSKKFKGTIEYELFQKDGILKKILKQELSIGKHQASSILGKFKLSMPHLWSPSSPYLYTLNIRIKDENGQIIDGYKRKIGIRHFEFKGEKGFWLNGKPYEKPLIGGNRHQDYAIVGNAVTNNIHWRDAKLLKDAGMEVIRNAHCPQDPAFLDACDELGLFVINNIPGWQFWNNDSIFEQRIYNDIKNLVRRDRNHPSIWLWEPILNETKYPEIFAKNANKIIHLEYPYSPCFTSCNHNSPGKELFPVLFAHPISGDKDWAIKKMLPKKSYFTREWGDNVDDWNAQNSPSRANRGWGEVPMLVQAEHYANPPYNYTTLESLYKTPIQHVGGCLWHSFDHQRGYHPDPFYGGLMDIFRQPKYSYYMFKAQRSPVYNEEVIAETGPMIYIAHEMTPFSPKDVTVYSNCEEVRLLVYKNGKQYSYTKKNSKNKMPSPIIVFPNAYHFMEYKKLKQEDAFILAEGIIDGKVVTSQKISPARRPHQITLRVDNASMNLKANGSDFITIIAEITDKQGNVKRLNNYYIKFDIKGAGRILGGSEICTNPRPIIWGSAPILVQSTTTPGKIKISATVLFEGMQTPIKGSLEINSIPYDIPLIFDKQDLLKIHSKNNYNHTSFQKEIFTSKSKFNPIELQEVEEQQAEFGETN